MLLYFAADRSYVLFCVAKKEQRRKNRSGAARLSLSPLMASLSILLLSWLNVCIVRQTHKLRKNEGTSEPSGSQLTWITGYIIIG